MKRLLALWLALCLTVVGTVSVLAEQISTPNDLSTATPEVSAAPEISTTPEATPESEIPDVTAEPTDEPTQEPILTPDASITPEPEATPIPATEAPVSADYGTGPLYVLDNGFKHYGTPEELIPLNAVLYLYHTDVIAITDTPIESLAALSYALDPDVFTDDTYTIYLSQNSPSGNTQENTVYLWAGLKQTVPTPTTALDDVINAGDEDILEWELQVIPADYTANEPCQPTFTLMALPDLTEGMSYAVILNDGEPQRLSGSSYSPSQSGEYRFALLDAEGNVVGRSARYKVIFAEPTQAPTTEPTTEPTAVPTEVPTPAPTAVPPMSMDDLQSSMDALIENNTGSGIAWGIVNGEVFSGSLDDLLNTDCAVIYIATRKTIVLSGDMTRLSGKTLLPDPDVFGSDWVVTIANTSASVELADALFVSVQQKTYAEETSAVLTVSAENLTQGKWQHQTPVFALSSEPDLPGTVGGYSYAVSVDGSAPVRLAESAYTALQEGSYTLRFFLLDPDNQTVAQSDDYPVMLDVTAPLLQCSVSRDGSMMIVAGDLGSGAVSCSIDGGASWQQMTDQGSGVASCTVTFTESTELASGMILVQDRAGNRTANADTVTVTVQNSSISGGFGSIRGGSTQATSHAASDVTTVTVYNGVDLLVDTAGMSQLIVGEEALDLFLLLDDADEDAVPPTFTASFASSDGTLTDTLLLTALNLPDGEENQYTWQFSGQVYKKLAASGIDYLALRCGDQLTVLSTAGFTGGIRYSMYRAQGIPSKDFIYTLRMEPKEENITLDVTVSGETWQLTDDPSAEIYYFDIVTGSTDNFDLLSE